MSKYVLITGASAGIGHEIAKEFAAKKFNLILVARREERLSVISKDLAQKYNISDLHRSGFVRSFFSSDDIQQNTCTWT